MKGTTRSAWLFAFFFFVFNCAAFGQSISTARDQFCASYTCPAPQPGQTVVCKKTLGNTQYANISNLLFVCNQVNGYFVMQIDGGYGSHDNQVLYNNISSSTVIGYNNDTSAMVVMKNQNNLRFEGNVITTTFPGSQQASIVKIYHLQGSQFIGNEINNNGGGSLAYAGLFLRSTCRDNTFARNVINARQAGTNRGIMSHWSNECCNADGVLMDEASPSQGPCQPPYAAGYDYQCHNRRNIFDSNKVYGSEYSVYFDDGSYQNTFKNNVLVSPVHIKGSANNVLYNNTIDGESGRALDIGASSSVVVRNNILRTSGASLITGTISGDYNLFWPAFSSGQAHSISANPLFANISATNPALRDYGLSSSSPAINVGDPNTAATPMSIVTDVNRFVRPVGGGFDLGAFEFGSGNPDGIAPSSPKNLSLVP
jgi:hypothetical protein